MKNRILVAAILISAFLSSFFIFRNQIENQFNVDTNRKAFKIAESENEHYSEKEREFKTDEPDKAFEQDYKKRIDPKLGYVPYERLYKAHEIAEANKRLMKTNAIALQWQERGPGDVGGRTRTIMFDPNDAGNGYKKLWVGSVSGGLWRTNDITANPPVWTHVDEFWDNLAITTIASDPTNTQNFYVGTGEGYGNLDAVRGAGIWKSTNGGTNWTRLASTNTADFYYIQKIVVHPTTGDVYAATSTGLWRSQNGGSSWTNVQSTGTRAEDIEIDAANAIFAAFRSNGIYKSTTGNAGSWTKLNTGANGFPTTGFARVEFSIAPSNALVMYAFLYDPATPVTVKTADGGATWTTFTTPPGVADQGWYDLISIVDPTNPSRLIVGTNFLYYSVDAGVTWTEINGIHPDHHALVYKPGSSTDLAIGCDGGIYYSTNANANPPTLTDKGTGYNTSQFYACAIHPTALTDYFLGGTQDNGSPKLNSTSIDVQTNSVWGGDGAFCFIDQDNPNFQIGSGQYYDLGRSTDGGNTWAQMVPPLTGLGNGPFICPADYDDAANILYSAFNSTTIRRVLDVTGTPTQSNITGLTLGDPNDVPTHIRVSPYTANAIYVGTDGAKVFKLTNANATPTVTDISTGLPTFGSVSCVEVGATDNQLLVTYSNYGVVSVWETLNGGTNWTNKEGNLPDIPVNWALYNPDNRNEAMLATDVGVWSTSDFNVASPTWSASNTGLANVRVDMFQIRASDKVVLAATHGRGLYTTTVFSPAAAIFSSNTQLSWSGKNIQFTDASIKATSWSWNFGDAGTSTLQNPTHSYTNGGTYSVALQINGGAGPIETKTNYIKILPPKGTPITAAGGGDFEDGANQNDFGSQALTGGVNIWERGVPTNTLTTVNSGTKAWKTDLDANVPQATYSCALYTPTYNFTAAGTYTVKFRKSMNFTFVTAPYGVQLQYSLDKGDTWTRLGNDNNDPLGTNWYNHGPGSTWQLVPAIFADGTGWNSDYTNELTTYNVSALAGNASVVFRFVFAVAGGYGGGYLDGFMVDDFEIDGPTNTVLPVELTSFTATAAHDKVILNWETDNEVDNYGFEIEKANVISDRDEKIWRKIGFVPGHGNSSSPKKYSFSDNNLGTGTKLLYRLKQIDADGSFNYSSTVEVVPAPIAYELAQNYPNPFNPSTTVKFRIQEAGFVKLNVYDLLGEKVLEVLNQKMDKGNYEANINGSNLASGVYVYRLEVGNKFNDSKKMLLLK